MVDVKELTFNIKSLTSGISFGTHATIYLAKKCFVCSIWLLNIIIFLSQEMMDNN